MWECFDDIGYFNMWAVRNKNHRRFNEAIHVKTKDEAQFLVAALNERDSLESEVKRLKLLKCPQGDPQIPCETECCNHESDQR